MRLFQGARPKVTGWHPLSGQDATKPQPTFCRQQKKYKKSQKLACCLQRASVLCACVRRAPFGRAFAHLGSLGVWSDPGLVSVLVCVCVGAELGWKGRSGTF